MARELDWAVFEKAVEITASAIRGAMGGENSQPATYAGDVFRSVWTSLKAAVEELARRGHTGFWTGPVGAGDVPDGDDAHELAAVQHRKVAEAAVEHQVACGADAGLDVDGRRVVGHPVGHRVMRGVEVAASARRTSRSVKIPGRPAFLDHERRADVAPAHERRRFGDGGGGFDRDQVLAHDVSDRRHAAQQA